MVQILQDSKICYIIAASFTPKNQTFCTLFLTYRPHLKALNQKDLQGLARYLQRERERERERDLR